MCKNTQYLPAVNVILFMLSWWKGGGEFFILEKQEVFVHSQINYEPVFFDLIQTVICIYFKMHLQIYKLWIVD